MMIARTILRLLAEKALSNNHTAPYPTIAGNEVYDTRLDDFDVVLQNTLAPVPRIGIYTTTESFDFGGGQSSNKIDAQNDIRIMFEVSVFGAKQDDMTGEIAELAFNDQYLSMKLDILETQIFDALFRNENQYTEAFKKFAYCVKSIDSSDDMGDNGQHKIAMRTLSLDLRVKQSLCNVPYDPAIDKWIDLYPELKNLIDCPATRNAIYQIPVNNSYDNFNGVNIDINSSLGVHPDTVTKTRINLDE